MERQRKTRIKAWLLTLFWLSLGHAWASSTPNPDSLLKEKSERVRRLYLESRERWEKNQTNADAGWRFAWACFDQADLSDSDKKRAAFAEEGIGASRRVIALAPHSAPAHYYLGLNLGQLAKTKLLGALKLLDGMEAEWKRVVELDAKLDYAGAHRALGILYREAPGWPTSLGSRSKARLHLQKAVDLAPEYPGNLLALLEARIKWGDRKIVGTQIETMERTFVAARKTLTGPRWTRDWVEWEQRWRRIKSKAVTSDARSPSDARNPQHGP